MAIKFLLFSALAFYIIACECTEDKFGEALELNVPINTYPNKDTFNIGDTLWVEADFSKDIDVRNNANSIHLDSFNFFTEMAISEISDTTELFEHLFVKISCYKLPR